MALEASLSDLLDERAGGLSAPLDSLAVDRIEWQYNEPKLAELLSKRPGAVSRSLISFTSERALNRMRSILPQLVSIVSTGFVAGTSLAQVAKRCDASPSRATVFAPALADSARTYGGAFAPDGRTLYFFRKMSLDPQEEDYRIFRASSADGWKSADVERVWLGGE
jgi:hypothetical protein